MSTSRRRIVRGESQFVRTSPLAGHCQLFPFRAFSSVVFAQGGPPAMPVGVSEPVAKRVTQWDEYSGRFEAARLRRKDGRASRASSTRSTSATARSSKSASHSSPSTSGPTRSPSTRPRPTSKARNRGPGRSRGVASQSRRPPDRPPHHHRSGSRPRKSTLAVARPSSSRAEAALKAQRPAQPRMDGRDGADRRPHLGSQGRCRQPDLGR